MTDPQETILVAGTEPQIAFFAHRRNATRYIFFDPLLGNYPGILENQRQALEEIVRNKPKYYVDVTGYFGHTLVKPGVTEMYFFNELEKIRTDFQYQPYMGWRALAATAYKSVPKCYLRMTPTQYEDLSNQYGKPLGVTLTVYKRGIN
jgi:hypothetical protein